MASLQAGTLQSSTRKGFRSFRRTQSEQRFPVEDVRKSESTALNVGRHSGQPSELICVSTSETNSLENKVTSRKINSTSTSGEFTPKISALIW